MKKVLFITVLALLPYHAAASLLVGDIDGDGKLTVVDVARLVDCIKSPDHYYNGVEYVDLGLPSGLLWAASNVGATKPEDYGAHFAWGETETKDDYQWSTYSLCDGTSVSINKYCLTSSYGTVDGLSKLQSEDDVARASYGGLWHIPTIYDWDELEDNSTIWADSIKHVHGWILMGKTIRNRLFLPNSGYRSADYIYNEGYDAFYWANGLYTFNSSVAYGYSLGSYYQGWGYRARYMGNPIRAVIYSLETVGDVNADGVLDHEDVKALAQKVITQ